MRERMPVRRLVLSPSRLSDIWWIP